MIKILEVGCAGGSIINLLIRLGAKEENINGIDILLFALS